MKEIVRKLLLDSGAAAVGFAKAGSVDKDVNNRFRKWIDEGNHAGMTFLKNHVNLRNHTDNVLPGANSVISLAFSYFPELLRNNDQPVIATYAHGEDYHDVIKELLRPVIIELQKKFGGVWRNCIDSAPVAERFWALMGGLGKRGLNGSIIVDGCGGYCFLCEILTTVEFEPDVPITEGCGNCGKCIENCPTGALNNDGTIDSRKCISYLTLEKKEDFTEEEASLLGKNSDSRGFLFGCDICLKVCPYNYDISPTKISSFQSKPQILELNPDMIEEMSESDFKAKFRKSPIKRCKLAGLKRNARIILHPDFPNKHA